MKRIAKGVKKSSYEVDIGEEFKAIKNGMKALENKLDAFIGTFTSQLKTLNENMEKVLSQISDHEVRLTKLEQEQKTAKIRKDTVSDIYKKACTTGQWIFHIGLIFAAMSGIGWAVKLLGFFEK